MLTIFEWREAARASLLFAWIPVAGCALNRAGEVEVTAARSRHESINLAAAYAKTSARSPVASTAGETAPGPAAPESGTRPQAVADLRDYIALALAANPDIHRAEESARARAARIPQVTALPDPMLTTTSWLDPIRTAEGDGYFTLGLSQKLPLPTKLTRAGRVALEETRMAIADWERTRLQVIADVKRAYFKIYIVDRTIEITRQNQALLAGLVETARGEVATGRRQLEDVVRAQVELSNLEAQLIDLRHRRTSAEAQLNALLNRDSTTPVPPSARFDTRRVDAMLPELFGKALEANPELKRLERQIERDEEAVGLARLAYWPDLTLGFQWMQMSGRDAFQPPGSTTPINTLSEDGSDNWAVTAGLNIPIWFQRIRGGIREAERKLAAARHQYDAQKNAIKFQVEDALSRVEAQRELAVLFDSTIIPQARQSFELCRAGYTVGRSDFQYVIDNWQKWLAFTIQYHRAVGELERSVADLEQAIGLSLDEANDRAMENEPPSVRTLP